MSISPVDIGFATDPPKRMRNVPRNPELEPLARRRELKLSAEYVHNVQIDKEAPHRRQVAADHYGIFADLFSQPHQFCPVVELQIFYPQPSSNYVNPVYCGNFISPKLAQVIIFHRL